MVSISSSGDDEGVEDILSFSLREIDLHIGTLFLASVIPKDDRVVVSCGWGKDLSSSPRSSPLNRGWGCVTFDRGWICSIIERSCSLVFCCSEIKTENCAFKDSFRFSSVLTFLNKKKEIAPMTMTSSAICIKVLLFSKKDILLPIHSLSYPKSRVRCLYNSGGTTNLTLPLSFFIEICFRSDKKDSTSFTRSGFAWIS